MHAKFRRVNSWSNTLLSIFFSSFFFLIGRNVSITDFCRGWVTGKVCHQDDGFNSHCEAITARATLLALREIAPAGHVSSINWRLNLNDAHQIILPVIDIVYVLKYWRLQNDLNIYYEVTRLSGKFCVFVFCHAFVFIIFKMPIPVGTDAILSHKVQNLLFLDPDKSA